MYINVDCAGKCINKLGFGIIKYEDTPATLISSQLRKHLWLHMGSCGF